MSIEELRNDPAYSLLLVLPHDDILPFISKYLTNKTVTVRFYFILLFALFAIIVWMASLDIQSGLISFWGVLKYLVIGAIPVFTILVPLHEGLHGLAYKLVGAPKVSFGANWRLFYFFAVADRFIIDRKSFVFVALLPFIIINLFTLIAMFMVGVELKWFLMGILFIHTTACAGDFAMMGFYEDYLPAKELLTYDDVKERRSYFYLRE